MCDIETDIAERRVIVTLGKAFGEGGGRACALAIQDAIEARGWVSGRYDLLIVADAYVTQPKDVAASVLDVAVHAEYKARRIACVSRGALAKLQLRRMLTDREVSFFETKAQAVDWLNQARPESAHPVSTPDIDRRLFQ